MNKNILPIILGVLLLSLISANLVIDPYTMDIETRINENKTFTANILNNYTFEILEVNFPGLEEKGFYFPNNISIAPGENKEISFDVITTESIHETIELKIEFKFLVDLPEEVTTYDVGISNSGFSEEYTSIRQGDTIMWNNQDTIIHRIYSTEFGTISIYPNLTQSYIFQNKGKFYYYDEDFAEWSFFNGNIEVVDRTEPQRVHNPTYDKFWEINLNSVLNPTNISVENSKIDYKIGHNKQEKGLLTFTNDGQEIAEIVHLTSSSDWLYFTENDFNIGLGENNIEWVEYSILPFVFSSNETNKTYTIDITIKASNSEEKTISVNLFVPYQDIADGLNTDIDIGMWYLRNYCPTHPCSIFCSPELPECQNNGSGTGQESGTSTLNITDQSWYEVRKSLSELKNSYTRSDNSLKELAELFGITEEQLLPLLNESLNTQKENERKEKSRKVAGWIVGIFLFLLAIIIIILSIINKKSNKESLVEGLFRWKSS